ncbi:hypothetical protein G7085_10080 [Tessaracoccus sp. HDW20]|nr:hypothetical protein [Tessaracoccus coleopterorum]NHB84827.1 hypothetical protein [Tessaracoccus coleopterorum]
MRWRYRLTGAASAFVVRDLPGTGWVALQAGQQVTLLDRLTGERQFRFDVPVSDAGVGWFGSSDRGSLLVAVPTNGVGGPRSG